MPAFRSALLTAVVLLLVGAALVLFASRPPAPLPATAPSTVFSAERAMRHVTMIAQRPHPNGSADLVRVREYLVAQLATIGLEPQIQQATGVGTRYPVAAQVQNVLARLPGRNPGGPAILLVAHYDGVGAGPAAGDDAAGVAALLETLRALRAGSPLAHDVIVLFTDGEESGLAGAAAFVRQHSWARDVAFILNFEGRGTRGLSLMFETGAGNLDTVGVLRQVPGVSANSLSVTVYRALPNDTDLSELAVLGQPALNFALADGLKRYHTTRDDTAHLDLGSVQHHGVQALALTRMLANGQLPRPRTGDAIFFTLPFFGLVVYPERFALPLAMMAGVLVLLGCIRLRRSEPLWVRGVSFGGGGIIVASGLGVAAAFGAARALEGIHAAMPQGGWPGSSGAYAFAIVMLALSVALGTWTLARRWASAAAAQLGALVVWEVLAMTIAWKAPGASFLFTWPLLGAAGAALVGLWRNDTRVVHLASWAATLVAAALIVPMIYTVAIVIFGVVGPGAATIGLFVPLTAWLLAPRLEELTAGGRWVSPIAALAVAFSCLLIGLATVQRSEADPEPSLLAYAVDANAPEAWLAMLPEHARPGSWGAGVLGPAARTVTPEQPARPGAPPEWLTRAVGRESKVVAALVPSVATRAPELKLIAAEPTSTGRLLELLILPAPGTYSIRIWAVDTPVLSAEVDGQAIDASRYRAPLSQWTLGYVAPPDKGFTLKLTVPRDTLVRFDLMARSFGLPQLGGFVIPQRPAGVVPFQTGDITVVYQRVRLEEVDKQHSGM
jgi:peptidase M28-like protein